MYMKIYIFEDILNICKIYSIYCTYIHNKFEHVLNINKIYRNKLHDENI